MAIIAGNDNTTSLGSISLSCWHSDASWCCFETQCFEIEQTTQLNSLDELNDVRWSCANISAVHENSIETPTQYTKPTWFYEPKRSHWKRAEDLLSSAMWSFTFHTQLFVMKLSISMAMRSHFFARKLWEKLRANTRRRSNWKEREEEKNRSTLGLRVERCGCNALVRNEIEIVLNGHNRPQRTMQVQFNFEQ